MARARLLHPEFARHEGLAQLSRSHRLLFALLPTIADREGKLEDRPRRIQADLFPYEVDPGLNLDGMLADLEQGGFIQRYESNGKRCILIPGFLRWQKPHPREKASELPNRPAQGEPRASPRQAKDTPRLPVSDPVSVSDPDPVSKDLAGGVTKQPHHANGKLPSLRPTARTWEAYSEAYRRRYKTDPVANATVNGQLAALVKRLGMEDSPPVAAFYVEHNGAPYTREGHSVGMLLKHAEKLHTEWKTGRRMTSTEASARDKTQENAEGWMRLAPGGKNVV